MTRQVRVGNILIGGGAPVSIQSMTNTDTRDVFATLKQIDALQEAGCQIVRLAVPDREAAEAFAEIKKEHPEEIRDPEKYASFAGWIILFLGVVALVMAAISFINVIASVVWVVTAVIVMGILWKILYEKYGEVQKDE